MLCSGAEGAMTPDSRMRWTAWSSWRQRLQLYFFRLRPTRERFSNGHDDGGVLDVTAPSAHLNARGLSRFIIGSLT
jgi:hypothetical protein